MSDGRAQPVLIRGYRDFELIGSGATSLVYRAHQDEFNRVVAVKILTADDPNDPARRRFAREKAIIGQLGWHPNIAQVFEASFTEDGRPFVSMRLYDGSAQDRLESTGPFPVDEALSIMAAITDATQAAHQEGILHRDIKPQNVLLSRYGPGLADFGIARSQASLERTGSLASFTPLHAPPEAFEEADPTPQGDIWSLGSTLYSLLAGHPPFAGQRVESILKYRERLVSEPLPPIARADVLPALQRTLARALAKDPADRHESAEELCEELRAAAAITSAPAQPGPVVASPAHDPAAVTDPMPADGSTIAVGQSRTGDQLPAASLPPPPPAPRPPAPRPPAPPPPGAAGVTTAPGPAKRTNRLPVLLAGALLILGIGGFALFSSGSDGEEAQRTSSASEGPGEPGAADVTTTSSTTTSSSSTTSSSTTTSSTTSTTTTTTTTTTTVPEEPEEPILPAALFDGSVYHRSGAAGQGCGLGNPQPLPDLLPDGWWFAHVDSFDPSAGVAALDLVCYFVGEDQASFAAEDGVFDDDGFHVRNDSPKLRTHPVSDTVAVTCLDGASGVTACDPLVFDGDPSRVVAVHIGGGAVTDMHEEARF
jgi:serine/threonine protein kinase